MSEPNCTRITSTFRNVPEIILSRFHLQLKWSRVVIKDISVTGIIARVPWVQENTNYAVASVPEPSLFTVTLLYSPHNPKFKRACLLGYNPWGIFVVSFDLEVMCLHSSSAALEPSPPVSGNAGLCTGTECLSTQPVWTWLQKHPQDASEYKLTLQAAELYLVITSSEQTEGTVPSSIYI